MMTDPNVNMDAATVANVVSGVINALGLQQVRGSTSSGGSSGTGSGTSDTSVRAPARHRPNARLAIYVSFAMLS